MATIDLGQFDRVIGSSSPTGPAYLTVRLHVVKVTDSERDERCLACHGPIPTGSTLYLVNGRTECAECYEMSSPALKPAPGYYPADRHGGAPEPPSQPRPWRHRH